MKRIISWFIRKIPRPVLQRFSHIVARVLAIFYLGNGVECTVCGSRFRKFLPYGVKARSNALCPHCLSLERHRLMWLYLKERTDFFSAPLRVLHIAPEYCFISRFSALPNLDYVTADLESPLAMVKMDVHDIPFEEGSFDVAFCNHVMEHVDDDIRAMSEIHRVLRPGGWAIIQSPVNEEREVTYEDASITSMAEREKHFGQKDHVREYGRDYPARLERAGFSVTEERYAESLGDAKCRRHGLYLGDRPRITIEESIFLLRK